MSTSARHISPLIRVAVPVAVATGLIAMALINLVVVRNWQRTAAVDDGVFWGADLRALEVSTGSAADDAGLRRGDWLQAIDGRVVVTPRDVAAVLSEIAPGQLVTYTVSRESAVPG